MCVNASKCIATVNHNSIILQISCDSKIYFHLPKRLKMGGHTPPRALTFTHISIGGKHSINDLKFKFALSLRFQRTILRLSQTEKVSLNYQKHANFHMAPSKKSRIDINIPFGFCT